MERQSPSNGHHTTAADTEDWSGYWNDLRDSAEERPPVKMTAGQRAAHALEIERQQTKDFLSDYCGL